MRLCSAIAWLLSVSLIAPAAADAKNDWTRRYRLKRVAVVDTAHDAPSAVLIASNESGVYQLYSWNVSTGKKVQVTDDPVGKSGGTLSPDGKWVYYLQDARGNEVGAYVRVPFSGGPAQPLTQNLPPYSSGGIDFDREGRFLVYGASDQNGYRFVRVDNNSRRREMFQSKNEAYAPRLSADGKYLALGQTERKNNRHFAVSLLDVQSGERLAELWDGEQNSIAAGRWSPRKGDERLLFNADKSGFWRPGIYDLKQKKRSDLSIDLEGSVTALEWSADTSQILLRQELDGRNKLFLFEVSTARLMPVRTPEGAIGGAWMRPDGKIWAMYQSAAVTPRLLEIDPRSGKSEVKLSSEDAPAGTALASIRYHGARGDMVHAFLGVPQNPNGAAIVYVHGGPKSVTADTFSPAMQGFLDAGYVVLAPNYHGSSGFGRDFSESILGDPMNLELQDFSMARTYLQYKGLVPSGMVFITGWSYGGYSTLSCLTRQPDDWAGGVAGIAIADTALQYEDARAPLRGWSITNFGGTPAEKPDLYRDRSPITYAEKLKAPLLIIQGKNDLRTPARQIQLFEKKLADLQKDFAVHWFDAGHGSLSIAEQIYDEQLAIAFFDQILESSKQRTPQRFASGSDSR